MCLSPLPFHTLPGIVPQSQPSNQGVALPRSSYLSLLLRDSQVDSGRGPESSESEEGRLSQEPRMKRQHNPIPPNFLSFSAGHPPDGSLERCLLAGLFSRSWPAPDPGTNILPALTHYMLGASHLPFTPTYPSPPVPNVTPRASWTFFPRFMLGSPRLRTQVQWVVSQKFLSDLLI